MTENHLDDVIQRWRNTQEKDLKPEDHELFLNVGQMCIAQGDTAQLRDFISDVKNQDVVKSMGSALLGPLIKNVVQKERDSVQCQAVITHLLQICSANNLLDILLRQVEETEPDVIADTITLLMQHIQTVLMRLGDSKPALLGLALDALHKQISKLPVPYAHKQEEEDKHGLGRCCTALLTFVQPFVQEVKIQDLKNPVDNTYHTRLRTVLLKHCMKSLKEPLLEAQLDKEAHTSQNSPLWNFATELMTTLPAIQEPLPKLLFYYPLRVKEGKQDVQYDSDLPESRACLAYLLFVQLIAIELFPAVFRKDETWILKGLDLYVKSLERILDNTLPVELLELKIFHSVSQYLILIMADCPIQHLRIKALVVFQLFIEKLKGEAKHKFFRCIIKTSQHAGVESFILSNIKNQVEQTSKSEQMDSWFKGTLLLALLRDTLSLPQGPETDILHGMDRIMVSLNLLRYLLIRERARPTGIWNDLCIIAENYIKTLRVCLGMSKSYYGSELKRFHEDKKVKMKEWKEISGKKTIQRTIGGMPSEEQEMVLQSALVTYDLMESLVIRIEEILEERA
ncbi:glomulin, FKBP associated protein b [Silurus asotus]|uniref:Glomulin, FKBP associated protein b n=1 Tax=Silurus asotus TaxID=30991 RepID=A0AAD5FU95_SILAS|nr:glomulin, FKBP associated protein b [Silurus asotus]